MLQLHRSLPHGLHFSIHVRHVVMSLAVLHFDPAFFMATEDREGILDAAVLAAALRGGVADLGRDVPAPDCCPFASSRPRCRLRWRIPRW